MQQIEEHRCRTEQGQHGHPATSLIALQQGQQHQAQAQGGQQEHQRWRVFARRKKAHAGAQGITSGDPGLFAVDIQITDGHKRQ
ncbi:hypothetical protein D3C77_535500 [compost metagenome]